MNGVIALFGFSCLICISLLVIFVLAIRDNVKYNNPYSGYMASTFILLIISLEIYFGSGVEITPITLIGMVGLTLLAFLFFVVRWNRKNKMMYLAYLSFVIILSIFELVSYFTIDKIGKLEDILGAIIGISLFIILFLAILYRVKNKNLYSAFMVTALIPFVVGLLSFSIALLNFNILSSKEETIGDWGLGVLIVLSSLILSIVMGKKIWKKHKSI